MKQLALISSLILSACAPATTRAPSGPIVGAPQMNLVAPGPAAGVVKMRSFPARAAAAPLRANSEMARDFLDLAFRMESGRAIPHLSRFEGPISVRLVGPTSGQTREDLNALVARLRSEAGLPISATSAPNARITVESVPRAALRRAVPNAACFVVPSVSGWNQYLAVRGTPMLDWKALDTRDRASVFIPADASPQEVRDCLHEELAQALGPLNDLYRLPDSVFNDDNIHAVLTGFDMLMLRVFYAPELRSGMTRGEVAARLPAILARLNPAGQTRAARPESDTTRPWIAAMETALGNGSGLATRQDSAERALNLARAFKWDGTRNGFAHYVYGRLHVRSNPDLALQAFIKADRTFAAHPETRLHRAYVAVQLASYALAQGNADQLMELTQNMIPVARAHENAALLATLMMFQAEALELQNRGVEAQAVRLDSLGWARYGFGSQSNVEARLREIRKLNPRS